MLRNANDTSAPSGDEAGGSRARPPRAPSPRPINPRLHKLYADLGGDQVVFERFVSDYLALLDVRLDTIRTDVRADHAEASVVALLSLETTSAMLGADGVASAARALRTAVETSDRDRCAALVSVVVAQADALRIELEHEGFRASS